MFLIFLDNVASEINKINNMHIIDDVICEKWIDKGHPPEDLSSVGK